jgi:outer membrane protein TolC
MGLYEINTKRSIEQVRMDVSKAYYNVQIAQERLVLLAQTTENIKKLKNDVEAMYKSGLVEKLDVDRMAVTYNNIETEKIKLSNFVELSIQLLKFQMGMPMQQKLAVQKVDEANIKQLAASIDKANFQYENRLDYNLVSTQLNLNKLDAKRYKWAAMPTIVAFGNAGYNYATSEFKNLFGSKYIFSSLWGIQANVPLFDGFQRRNKLKQAEFAIEKTKNDLATLSQAIDLEQEQASTNLKNNFLALESQKTNVNLAQSVFDLSKKKYEAGVGSNTEVVQAESALREAQSNYYGALLNVFISKIDLQKSLGLLK